MNTNLKSHINILKQEGTSRFERDSPALDPANVSIDGRKLQDFISYVQRYSANVLFVDTDSDFADTDPNNLEEKFGSWDFFFKQDAVLLIANIATKNVQDIKVTYDRLATQFQKENTIANFIELADYVFSRFQKINGWYYTSSYDSSLKNDLILYIRSYLIDELETLQDIKFYIHNLKRSNYSADDFKIDLFDNNNIPKISELLRKYHNIRQSKRNTEEDIDESNDNKHSSIRQKILLEISILLGKDNIWDIKDKQDTSSREHIFAGDNEEEKLYNASLRLDKIFETVYHVIEIISNSCNNYFEDTINKKQDHPPHVALLIAFIKLYGNVQKELNKIPQKHLDFYYREVLKIKEKNAVPDQVFIVFDLAQGFETGEVKKGTTVSAGKDKHNVERIYEINNDIIINKASVASLNTVFIAKDTDQHFEKNKFPIINYYSETIKDAETKPSDTSLPVTSWKVFGEPQKGNVAEIGLAIASTQFYLTKGERSAVITFELQADIPDTKFDTNIIKLILTGEKGWLNSDIPDSRITVKSLEKIGEKKIQLSFSISIAQEYAIVPFDKKIHEGNFNTSFPVLKCILKYPAQLAGPGEEPSDEWKAQITQLNILQRLKIVKTSIMVQVGSLKPQATFDGVRDLILENHETILEGKKPFYPFTPVPRVGSSFYIGCDDLFYKDIKNLSVNIEWLLPENFSLYYQNYLPPYDSNKFKATLSILKNHVWKKIDDISVIDVDTKEPKFRSIKLDSAKLKAENISPEAGIASYDNTRKNQTIRLKLLYPDFGHAIYPQLITSSVMEKASSKASSIDFYKVVKKELHDSAISIKLPEDLNERSGSLKIVVFDVLDRVEDDAQARVVMVKGLSEIIKRNNGSNIILSKGKQPQIIDDPASAGRNRVEVNDDNIIERFFGLLKKIKLIPEDIHYDKDKQDTTDVVDDVKEKVNSVADFIMPSDNQLISIIINETNNAINKTVGNIVDQLLEIKKIGEGVSADQVAELIKKEFGEANGVINDMIAHKIAILLSANEIPPPPYTPLINKISISYSSVTSSSQTGDQFFYITPLGVSEINLLQFDENLDNKDYDQSKADYIFPTSIVNNKSSDADMEGMLFIGIKDIIVNQNLSLLIQLTEGSKINDKMPPEITWWYRSNSSWKKLDKDYLVSDSTSGFQTTGIVILSIPADANNDGTLFGINSLFWFCTGVVSHADSFPMLVDIKTQAAVATFKDQGNDPGILALPLEAAKIKSLVNKVPFVKKISQPVSSFNGKPREQEKEYYTRTSERLRHKSRAINNWDYERLVLENFPFLFKVKCLNNYYSGQFLPGHVTVVPITDLRNRNYAGSNLLIPKTNYIDLRNIEKFLSARSSPFVKIHAINPRLDHVLVSCKVKFHTKVDKGFFLRKLNEDLVNFLTPWAVGDMHTLSFSSKIYASSIINFIDKRDYINYVQEFVMMQYTEDEKGERIFSTVPDQLASLEETVFTTDHSILVSAPAHEIQLIED